MKLQELFEGKIQQRDDKALRRDYLKWKKLVNVPTNILRDMLPTTKAGLSPHDRKIAKSYRITNTAARATLRLRLTPLANWKTADVNWMYRQLKYIEDTKLRNKDLQLMKDGKPTSALKNLWAWGHVPRGLKPSDK